MGACYFFTGCVAYQWDTANRTILHKLDCSKLAPCSESLMSISIEEHLSRMYSFRVFQLQRLGLSDVVQSFDNFLYYKTYFPKYRSTNYLNFSLFLRTLFLNI